MSKIDQEKIADLLRLKEDGSLYHRESKNLEFKENFSDAVISKYLRHFAAFGNNTGGYLVFGVSDSPRKLIGLTGNSAKRFEEIDNGYISGELLKLFSPDIDWEKDIIEYDGKKFGVFYVEESTNKPIIATNNSQDIKNGEIFFRYGARTQKIQHAELVSIIDKRVQKKVTQLKDILSIAASTETEKIGIIDTEKGIIKTGKGNKLLLDPSLVKKLNIIKEGSLSQEKGAPAYKLVGEIQTVNLKESIKIQKENLLEIYPLTCKEVIAKVKDKLPKVKQPEIHRVIKESNLKGNSDYSAYVFRSKAQEEEYKPEGKVPSGIPSIYNQSVVDYIVQVLQTESLGN